MRHQIKLNGWHISRNSGSSIAPPTVCDVTLFVMSFSVNIQALLIPQYNKRSINQFIQINTITECHCSYLVCFQLLETVIRPNLWRRFLLQNVRQTTCRKWRNWWTCNQRYNSWETMKSLWPPSTNYRYLLDQRTHQHLQQLCHSVRAPYRPCWLLFQQKRQVSDYCALKPTNVDLMTSFSKDRCLTHKNNRYNSTFLMQCYGYAMFLMWCYNSTMFLMWCYNSRFWMWCYNSTMFLMWSYNSTFRMWCYNSTVFLMWCYNSTMFLIWWYSSTFRMRYYNSTTFLMWGYNSTMLVLNN